MKKHATTLTEIEALGLQSQFNFADGHAYQDLARSQQSILARLEDIWRESANRKVKEAEALYQEAFWKLANSPSLKNELHFKICPTASNSIDTVAAWLAEKKMTVALMHPTFDNLYLILKRRGVEVVPLEETIVHDAESLPAFQADAIFLVNPNNPTGRNLSESQFQKMVEACVKQNKTLLLDNTFRFFVEPSYDQYAILKASGVTYISIEDTGKVWPTQDMKASLIYYSPNIAKEVEIIYEEIYLCVSNFTLGILTEFLKDAKNRGLHDTIWQDVKNRRVHFRKAITGLLLEVDPVAMESKLSVEWVRIKSVFASDLEIMEYFRKKDLVLLPGRNFFWAHPHSPANSLNIRFSLLKPKLHFLNAVQSLNQGLFEALKMNLKEGA